MAEPASVLVPETAKPDGGFRACRLNKRTNVDFEFPQDGAIGSQFDASKDGIAGQVEKAVDGPARPASHTKDVKVNAETPPGSQR